MRSLVGFVVGTISNWQMKLAARFGEGVCRATVRAGYCARAWSTSGR